MQADINPAYPGTEKSQAEGEAVQCGASRRRRLCPEEKQACQRQQRERIEIERREAEYRQYAE